MRPRLRLAGQFEDLPGSRHKACGRASVLCDRGVRRFLTKPTPAMLPSAGLKAVAHRTNVISLLNNPAHSYRYRRFACPLTGAGARLAEKRGSVRPSYRGTSTPYLLPVRLAHQNRTKPYRDRTLSVQIRTPRRAYARRIRETQTTRVCEVYAETAGVGCEIRLMTGSGVLGV